MHKKVYEYLVENGVLCDYDEKSNEIIINVSIEADQYRLVMKFPKFFPYEFPEIYIYDDVDFIFPHRYTNKQLCLYDENEIIPNPDQYLVEALETVNRAKKLLFESKDSENILDFNNEALSYWDSKSKINIDFIGGKENKSRIMWGYKLILSAYVVAENEERIQEFIKNSYEINLKTLECQRVLFLNVGEQVLIGIQTIEDILKMIKNNNDMNVFYGYLTKNYEDCIIIINADNGFGECLFAVKFKLLSNGIKVKQRNIKGVLAANKTRKIEPLNVKDFRMKRLFTRGGDGTASFNKKCLFIGCGSVGSYLSKAMIDIGITDDIGLIDNDRLSEVNIGRHLCGSNYLLSSSKVDALRSELLKHYPSLNYEAIEKNILEYLQGDVSFLNKFDLILVSVGNTAIEKKIIQLLKQKKIYKDCIIMWVEPYLIAGHALIFQQDIDITTECNIFDENGRFNNSVLVNGKQYLKSEAGCQSAYAPYAGYEVQKFVLDFTDMYYRKIYEKEERGNYSFTWIGKIRWARMHHLEIKPEWRAKDDRYIELKRIDNINEL